MMRNEVSKKDIEEYSQLPYAIIVEPGDAGGELCYTARHPELPGCRSQGATALEAIENLQEAREMYIEGLLEDKMPVPEPEFKIIDKAA